MKSDAQDCMGCPHLRSYCRLLAALAGTNERWIMGNAVSLKRLNTLQHRLRERPVNQATHLKQDAQHACKDYKLEIRFASHNKR